MKKILVTAVAALTLGTSAFAGGDIAPVEATVTPCTAAKTGLYLGGGVTALFTDTIGLDNYDGEDGYGIQLNIGYDVYTVDAFNVAVEARLGKTFWSMADDTDVYTAGLFVKPEYKFGDFGVYGLAGYGVTKTEVNHVTDDASDFVWGGGADYAINSDWEVFIDYVVYPETSNLVVKDGKNDILTLGVNYNF
jgi:hypothetical protein